MHFSSNPTNPSQGARVPAVRVHLDALRRLLRRRESVPPKNDLSFAGIFYGDYIFTQILIDGKVLHSRWRIHRGDLLPFRPTPAELSNITKYFRRDRGMSDAEIGAVLAIDRHRVKELLAVPDHTV